MATIIEGQGITKGKSSETMTTERRAKKRADRRGHGSSTNHVTPDSFYMGLLQDRRELREAKQAEREAAAYEFQVNQAMRAREFGAYQNLKRGTTAYEVAEALLEAFPLAQAGEEDGKPLSKTEMARREVLSSLSDATLDRVRAVEYGIGIAKSALRWAYDQLQAELKAEADV